MESWDRLAEAAKARRKQLGLSQAAVAAVVGGPSLASVKNIERGSRGYGKSMNSATGLALDKALRWVPGSTLRVLSGQASGPEPLDTPGWPTRDGDWAAYVIKREREDEDARDFRAGTDAAEQGFARRHNDRERPGAMRDISDAELVAELARRLAEGRRDLTPAREQEE
jgi:transcriptional regulator with XRE-family HTH domain